jgi:hypothetical protein
MAYANSIVEEMKGIIGEKLFNEGDQKDNITKSLDGLIVSVTQRLLLKEVPDGTKSYSNTRRS